MSAFFYLIGDFSQTRSVTVENARGRLHNRPLVLHPRDFSGERRYVVPTFLLQDDGEKNNRHVPVQRNIVFWNPKKDFFASAVQSLNDRGMKFHVVKPKDIRDSDLYVSFGSVVISAPRDFCATLPFDDAAKPEERHEEGWDHVPGGLITLNLV